MFAYLVIYSLSTACAYCYAKSTYSSAQKFFFLLTFLILFLPYGFRYNIGTDYKNYVYLIESASEYRKYNKFEIGWWPLLKCMEYFNLSTQTFFIVSAFASVLIMSVVIPKEYFYLGIPVYVAMTYLSSFTSVRQSMAAVVFMLSFKYWFEGKYKRSVIWGVIACCFHTSAIFLLVMLPFTKLKWSLFSPVFNGIAFIMLIAFLFVTNFGNFIMNNIVRYTPWAKYVDSIFAQGAEMGTGLGFMLKEFLCFLGIVIIQKDRSKEIDVNYNLMTIYTVVLGCFLVLGIQVHILGRLKYLFDPFYIFIIIRMLKSKSKYKAYAVWVFEFAMFLFFVKTILSNPTTKMGGLGIYPYASILSSF